MFTRNLKEVEITFKELRELIGLGGETFRVKHVDVDDGETITVTLVGQAEGIKHGL